MAIRWTIIVILIILVAPFAIRAFRNLDTPKPKQLNELTAEERFGRITAGLTGPEVARLLGGAPLEDPGAGGMKRVSTTIGGNGTGIAREEQKWNCLGRVITVEFGTDTARRKESPAGYGDKKTTTTWESMTVVAKRIDNAPWVVLVPELSIHN